MKTINLETWERKQHFEFFNRMDYPQFNICMNIDISRFLQYTKREQLPFHYAMIHSVMTVANRFDSLKYRIHNGEVVLHDMLHPSFTAMKQGNDLFSMITIDMLSDVHEFVKSARMTQDQQTDYFGLNKLIGRDDFIYITSIPWISFTHISHTITLNKNDAVPRISWGKYFTEGEKTLLPFSIQVHHAFVDGYHVGMFVEDLQNYVNII